jgi:nicotinamidase-related amidase
MKRALLVIDVQNEYFTGKLPVTHPKGSLDNILKAMDSATSQGVLVVVIQHTAPQQGSATFARGTPEWELHPEIARRHSDLLLEKNLPGSFSGTDLEPWLRQHGIDTVAIAGYMTQLCCDTTSRQAFERGFNVEFLMDATGTLSITNRAGAVKDEELHRAILVTQAMRFSRVLSTSDWIAGLE